MHHLQIMELFAKTVKDMSSMSVRSWLPGVIILISLMVECQAQSNLTRALLLATGQSPEMAQRVFQYEIILGRELSSNIGLCIDGELSYAWMLPENADSELSLKAIERVKNVQRVCEDRFVRDSNVFSLTGNLTAGIRTVMAEQLQAAQVLEQTKKSTRICLTNSQSQDTYKSCIQMALPLVPSDFQWTKWFSLFERRATLLALNQVEKMPPQAPSTRDVRPP